MMTEIQTKAAKSLDPKDIRVALGCCTVEGFSKKAADSIMGLVASNMLCAHVTIAGTLLPHARNKVVEQVYKNKPDFTHIIFVDADMCGYGPQHVARLVMADKSIISALVVSRKAPYKIVIHSDNEPDMEKHIKAGDVIESKFVGMAFTVIRRDVLDATRELTPNGPIWFTTDRDERDTFAGEASTFIKEAVKEIDGIDADKAHYSEIKLSAIRQSLNEAIVLGQQSHIGSQLVGEDIAFCTKALALGFQPWVDCGVHVGHLDEVALDWRHAYAAAQNQIEKPKLRLVEA